VTSQHSNTPLVVPITPYSSRGLDPRTPIDPRLAHLAGVAADPRLGLSPASMGYMMNPFYSSYLASHMAAAAAAGLWRPPPPPSPSLAGSPAPRTLSLSSAATINSVQSPSPTPPPASSSGPSFSAWAQQYRGEPRVEAHTKREVQRVEQPMDTSTGNDCSLPKYNYSINFLSILQNSFIEKAFHNLEI
jgi:hypothetical protein